MQPRIFRLAPMSPLMWALTSFCIALPALFLAGAVAAPWPMTLVGVGAAAFMLVLYGVIALLLRPTRFIVDARGLTIEWPVWRRTIPRAQLRNASLLAGRAQIRARLGHASRLGAGGFLGGFGFAITDHGLHELWVSRESRFVLVERDGGRNLLLTPDDEHAFVDAILLRDTGGAA